MCPYILGNTLTFCTEIPFAVHFNCAEKEPTFIREEHQLKTIGGGGGGGGGVGFG